MNNTPHKFELTADSKIINFASSPIEIFNRVLISDSIFDFYPDMEVVINDEAGMISDYLVSSEGLKFNSKLGNDDDGYLESEWALAENQLQDTKKSFHVGGDCFLGFDLYPALLDVQKSNAYNDTLSTAVTNIIKEDFNITSNTLITSTSEKGYRYRFNEFAEKRFNNWADIAYSQSFATSPFVTFFDASGKFHFCAIEDMYKQAEFVSDEPYILDMSNEAGINFNAIDDYNAFFVGTPLNKDNYRKRVYSDKKDATSENSIYNIEDYKLSGTGNFLIPKDLLDIYDGLKPKSSSTLYAGIYDEVKEAHFMKGFITNEFFNSYFPIRFELVIKYNRKALSGKKIKTEIGSALADKNDSSVEYSGDWLILESKHQIDADAIPYSKLLLGKSGTKVDPVQPFKDILV